MNPFDLAGPQFLVFYAALAAVTLAVLVLHRQGTEGGPAAILSDPYEIAYLRNGWQEAVSLAVASLIQRDLLCAHPFGLAEGVTPEQAASPLERQVLSRCTRETDPQRLIEDQSLRGATEEIRQSLVRQGLLPGPEVELQRRWRMWLAQAVLMGTALIKVAVALWRGHTNLVFLLALAVLSAVAAQRLAAPRRTRRGDETLRHLNALLARLRKPPRGRDLGPHEATLVGAVFGLAAVGGPEWVRLAALHPRVTRSDSGSSSWSWSCGSSSSGGSSCGSGCGGCGGGGD
jgi:uncharacterized protein (TIGR04222 family)